MIIVRNVRQTCDGCPSQWEGETDDGRSVYVRYRNGFLRVSAGRTMDDAVGDAERLFDGICGDPYDGFMSDAELADITRGVIEWHSEEPA